jgi:hypothetical protein
MKRRQLGKVVDASASSSTIPIEDGWRLHEVRIVATALDRTLELVRSGPVEGA